MRFFCSCVDNYCSNWRATANAIKLLSQAELNVNLISPTHSLSSRFFLSLEARHLHGSNSRSVQKNSPTRSNCVQQSTRIYRGLYYCNNFNLSICIRINFSFVLQACVKFINHNALTTTTNNARKSAEYFDILLRKGSVIEEAKKKHSYLF